MSEAQAERAIERIYEDISMRDELEDNAANELLKWAEDQIVRLAEKGLDDDTFDEQFTLLRKMLKTMNRLTGRRMDMSLTEQQEKMNEITADAQSLGYKTDPDTATAQGAVDNVGMIRALTAMFKPDDENDEEENSDV